MSQTVKSVFEKVYTCELKTSTNELLFASNDTNMVNNLFDNISNMNSSNPLKNVFQFVIENLKEVTDSSHIFTDEVAPVDILGQKLLNSMVQDETSDLKEMINFKEKGFKGLFDMLR